MKTEREIAVAVRYVADYGKPYEKAEFDMAARLIEESGICYAEEHNLTMLRLADALKENAELRERLAALGDSTQGEDSCL